MTFSSLPAPLLSATAAEPRTVLLAVAPAAVVLAVVLVLLTAAAVVGLVVEVRRDGYGRTRPRPLSPEFPWQTEPVASRRRRQGDSRSFLRAPRAAGR